MPFKKIIKSILPPFVLEILKKTKRYGWFGNYKSWAKAKDKCTGYNTDNILNKVRDSLLKVKNKQAVYERDSVLFDKIEYSWPLLAGLMWIASAHKNRLNVLDFGGSLGSTYFQNRKFLKTLDELKWNIVEQKNFVQCGKKYFQNNQLKFYNAIENCLEEQKPAVIIIAAVLPYIEKPYELLQKIINYKFDYIIIDRTGFYKKDKDIITIQKVPPKIYQANYPCWFFSEPKFLKFILRKYNLIADFEYAEKNHIYINNSPQAKYKGFVLRRKNNKT